MALVFVFRRRRRRMNFSEMKNLNNQKKKNKISIVIKIQTLMIQLIERLRAGQPTDPLGSPWGALLPAY